MAADLVNRKATFIEERWVGEGNDAGGARTDIPIVIIE